MEKQTIITYQNDMEAVQGSFGLYFILNLEYPKTVSHTLEFIQRYFLKIHPDQGTKSRKMKTSKKRIIALINKLKDM